MARRTQEKIKPPVRERDNATGDVAPAAGAAAVGEALKSELDELLNEIDGVLETNAADFVDSYIQKGGE